MFKKKSFFPYFVFDIKGHVKFCCRIGKKIKKQFELTTFHEKVLNAMVIIYEGSSDQGAQIRFCSEKTYFTSNVSNMFLATILYNYHG